MSSPINALLALLYPKENKCALCGAPGAAVLCAHCRRELRAPEPRCPVCGRRSEGLCPYCAGASVRIRAGVAAWDYNSASAAVVTAIKFRDRRDYLPFAAEALARACVALPVDDIDAVTAVPAHWLRRFRRGFNQSEELARLVARRLGLPYLPAALKRPVYCRPASAYSIADARRARAARRSYALGNARLRGLKVLLIDDVLTSGSTLQACAGLLLRGGAAGVYTAVVTAAPAPLDKQGKP
ncbi:MAG: double zinc ribbon domain-containing protein [Eubacteriales bacterium]|nr:double zinc ribbon domain-containing protein [Eubacteriales bacterium]